MCMVAPSALRCCRCLDVSLPFATVLFSTQSGLLPAGQQAANEMAAVSLLQAQALHQLQQQQQCNSPPPLHSAASRRVRPAAKRHTTLQHCGWAPLTAAMTQSHHGQAYAASASGFLHAEAQISLLGSRAARALSCATSSAQLQCSATGLRVIHPPCLMRRQTACGTTGTPCRSLPASMAASRAAPACPPTPRPAADMQPWWQQG